MRLLYRYVIRRFRDKQYACNYHLIFAVMWCGAMWRGIIKSINRWTDTAVFVVDCDYLNIYFWTKSTPSHSCLKNNIAHLTSHDMLISRDNHIYYFNVHYLILNNKMKFVVVNVQIITIYHKHSSVSPTIYTLNNTSPHGAVVSAY
jgi:hypothetical protein